MSHHFKNIWKSEESVHVLFTVTDRVQDDGDENCHKTLWTYGLAGKCVDFCGFQNFSLHICAVDANQYLVSSH